MKSSISNVIMIQISTINDKLGILLFIIIFNPLLTQSILILKRSEAFHIYNL